MSRLSGFDIIAKCFKKEEVDTVFTLTGEHIQRIFYGCYDSGIEVVDVRHEGAAMAAAEGYAKSSGRPGVVVLTAGPGITNSLTSLIEAAVSCTPIVVIGGSSPLATKGRGELQDYELIGHMRSICKAAEMITQTSRIAETIQKAFRLATCGVPGPVFVEVPYDVARGEIYEGEVILSTISRPEMCPYGDPDAIEKAADLLVNAKRPAMVIGTMARYFTKQGAAVKELAEYLTMPVLTTNLAKGLFCSEEELLFQIGSGAVTKADVILELNARNDFTLFQASSFNKDAHIIQVHPDADAIGWNRDAEVAILGGAGPVAFQLLNLIKARTPKVINNKWIEEADKLYCNMNREFWDAMNSDKIPIEPAQVAKAVGEFISQAAYKDWTFVLDGGDINTWTIPLRKKGFRPGQVLRYGSFGPMGLGLPYALGAWFANRKPIVLLTGDGALGFHILEFTNMIKHNIPIVVVVSNDSAWGMIKSIQYNVTPSIVERYENSEAELKVAINLPNLSYEKIAEVLGGYGEYVVKPEDIYPAMERAVASGKSSIINVCVADPMFSIVSPGSRGHIKAWSR